jgi:hypothetical protein
LLDDGEKDKRQLMMEGCIDGQQAAYIYVYIRQI